MPERKIQTGGATLQQIKALGATAVLCALMFAADGCSSGSARSGGLVGPVTAPTTLAAALRSVPVTSWDTDYLEFSDTRELAAFARGGLRGYSALGDPTFGQAETPNPYIDLTAVTAAVTVGIVPAQASILYGRFDPAAIGKKLAAAGYTQQGTDDDATLWLYSSATATPAESPVADSTVDAIALAPTRIIYSSSLDSIEQIAVPPTRSLYTDTAFASVADCLGSAKAGLIDPEPVQPPEDRLIMGVGLQPSSAKDTRQEYCVDEPNGAAASALEANWTKQLTTGRRPSTDTPWSQEFGDPRAQIASSAPLVVRLTADPVTPDDSDLLFLADTGGENLEALLNP